MEQVADNTNMSPREFKIWVFTIVAIVAVTVVTLFLLDFDLEKTIANHRHGAALSRFESSCQETITQKFKYPPAVEFPKTPEYRLVNKKTNVYIVAGVVYGQNGFGGMGSEYYYCVGNSYANLSGIVADPIDLRRQVNEQSRSGFTPL